MKSFQSNFAESFKGKFDKFSQAAEEKFSDVKTAIQKKLNENNENNNNNRNDVAVDNSADLLQGWTLLGGDKNTRNKNIEFNDDLLEENAEREAQDHADAEHAENAGNAGDAGTYAEDAPASPREDLLQNVSLTTTTNNNNNNNNNVDKKGNDENKVARKENAGYFSILTSAVIWNILSLVDAFDLCQLSTTSSHFFKLATNEFLWERLYIKVFRKNNMKVDKALWYEQLQHGGYRALFGTKLCEEQMMKTLKSLHNTSPEANAVEWIFKPFVSVQNFFSSTEAKILMFGLDYSGKTSILYKLARGEHVKTEHTVGFNHESIEHKGYKFELWDLEHKPKNSFEFWKTYFTKARGIIFVVDGTAPERLPQARTCLETFIADPQLSDLPILVFVNKRDVVESMSTLQVVVGLNLHYLCNRSGWHIQPCSAKDNDSSLENGLDWFCDTFKQEEVQRLKTKIDVGQKSDLKRFAVYSCVFATSTEMLELLKEFFIFVSPTSNVHPQHWFNPPDFHAQEYLCYLTFYLGLFLYCIYVLQPKRKPAPPKAKNNITLVEHILGLSLIICLVVQTTYNIIMLPWKGVVVMLHPCHLLSSMEVYLIYAKNPKKLHTVFNLAIFFTFYTSLALMLPDTSDLYLPFHVEVFWIQHWLAYLIPFYFILTKRFTLDNKDLYYLLLGLATANLVHFNVLFFVSLYTSVNVNYTLFPSPSSPPFMKTAHFKTVQGTIIQTCYLLHGYFFPRLVQKLGDLFFSSPSSPSFKKIKHTKKN